MEVYITARTKDSPQKAALLEMMGNYLKENNITIKDSTDARLIMRDLFSIILEGTLEQGIEEQLRYSKYDYWNKNTDNSRNSLSQKTMHISYGDIEIDVPRDRKSVFEPHSVISDLIFFEFCFKKDNLYFFNMFIKTSYMSLLVSSLAKT